MASGLASTLLLFLLARLLLVAIAPCRGLAITLASCVGQSGVAARDVDILAVVGHMLQGELGPVAGTQAPISGFCRDKGKSGAKPQGPQVPLLEHQQGEHWTCHPDPQGRTKRLQSGHLGLFSQFSTY